MSIKGQILAGTAIVAAVSATNPSFEIVSNTAPVTKDTAANVLVMPTISVSMVAEAYAQASRCTATNGQPITCPPITAPRVPIGTPTPPVSPPPPPPPPPPPTTPGTINNGGDGGKADQAQAQSQTLQNLIRMTTQTFSLNAQTPTVGCEGVAVNIAGVIAWTDGATRGNAEICNGRDTHRGQIQAGLQQQIIDANAVDAIVARSAADCRNAERTAALENQILGRMRMQPVAPPAGCPAVEPQRLGTITPALNNAASPPPPPPPPPAANFDPLSGARLNSDGVWMCENGKPAVMLPMIRYDSVTGVRSTEPMPSCG